MRSKGFTVFSRTCPDAALDTLEAAVPVLSWKDDPVKRLLILVLALAAIGGAAAAYYFKRGASPMTVNTVPLTRGDIADSVASTGTLQPVTTVIVGSQVSGSISFLGADFNAIVHKGDVLAKLDPSLFQAQIDQDNAAVANQKAQLAHDESNLAYQRLTYERNLDLRKLQIVSQDTIKYISSGVRPSNAECGSTRLCAST